MIERDHQSVLDVKKKKEGRKEESAARPGPCADDVTHFTYRVIYKYKKHYIRGEKRWSDVIDIAPLEIKSPLENSQRCKFNQG